MNPELDNVLLTFIESIVSQVYSLEYFGHISHIEDIVRFGWSWQELFLNQEEKTDCCHCKGLGSVLDVFIEL
jgi:hypothetical protein